VVEVEKFVSDRSGVVLRVVMVMVILASYPVVEKYVSGRSGVVLRVVMGSVILASYPVMVKYVSGLSYGVASPLFYRYEVRVFFFFK
jgi:hypothetical protein